jgi:hypothetical protein
MNKTLLALAITTSLSAWPSAAVIAKTEAKKPSQDEIDRQLFYRQALADLDNKKELLPIDQALAKLIPDPYIIYVDKSVPSTLQLSFVDPGKNGDWLDSLEKALAVSGLIVQPDWNRNTLRIVSSKSQDRTPSGQGPSSVSSSPVMPVFRGRFESAGTDNSKSRNPALVEEVSVKTPARDEAPAAGPELRVIRSSHLAGRLPVSSDMWELMQAAVAGRRIMLVGYSAVTEEKTRIRLSNTYAHRLRARLMEIGFPAHLVVVHERKEYKEKSERPQVQVVVEQLSGAAPTASATLRKKTGSARLSRHLQIILDPQQEV